MHYFINMDKYECDPRVHLIQEELKNENAVINFMQNDMIKIKKKNKAISES